MRKRTEVKLTTVLRLKEYVENEIKTKYDNIKEYNEGEMNMTSLFEDIDFYEEELINLKEKIRKANNGKHDDNHTNDYYIYLLSNINRRIFFYKQIETTDTTFITTGEANKKIRELQKEAEKIRNKLASFNENTKIKLDLSDERLNKFI